MEALTLIPLVNLQRRNSLYSLQIKESMSRVLESGVFVGGPEVEAFESEFADYLQVTNCIGVGNGLDGLRLILAGLGIGPGDEVIVPAQTFIATWLAVVQVGATPIPVDVSLPSGNLDPNLVQSAITPRTSAIIAVHLHGRVADMKQLGKIASDNQLALIEDAAQAHGAEFEGRKAGSLGIAAAFSFYPTKNLGALGDAGCIATDDDALAERIRSLGNYGATAGNKYVHVRRGWNSRLDPLQASVLRLFLPHLDSWNEQRRSLAAEYTRQLLGGTAYRILPANSDPDNSAWHHYVLLAERRDALRQHLAEHQILSEMHYPRTPLMADAFVELRQQRALDPSDFPASCSLADRVLSLPLDPWMGTDINRVLHALEEFEST